MQTPALRCLIAEDDPAFARLLSELCRDVGVEATRYADGDAAWAAYQAESADLVLSDWVLPGCDGLELCRRIRATPDGAAAVVVIVTGQRRLEGLEPVLAAGGSDYILKTADPTDLRIRIGVAVRQARALRAEAAATAAQRAMEARFATLADHAPVGMLELSSDGRCLLANRQWGALTGQDPEAARNLGWLEAIEPTRRPGMLRALESVSGSDTACDGKLIGPDGPIWAAWRAGPILAGADGTTSRVVTVADVSARKAAEAALEAARRSAVEATRLKADFLATMSHEIRTPLHGLLGMTGLLLDSALDDEQREFAEQAQRCGETLLELVNDILDFSKIEAGKLELEVVPTELRGIAEDAAAIVAERAEAKGLTLACLLDPDAPFEVRADPLRLRQILLNLLGNAVKFTEAGAVTLHVGRRGDDVVFAVHDTGIGIASQTLARLFQPFTQADASTTRVHGGTGLGLAISRRLTERMGGVLEVDSTPGAGSTFRVVVPLAATATPAPSPVPALQSRRALAVGSSGAARHALRLQLEACGLVVAEAADAAGALLALASGQRPDVLVLDDATEDVRRLLDDEALAADRNQLPALVVCCRAGRRSALPNRARAGVAVVTRPVRLSTLRTALLASIAGRASDVALRGPTAPSTGRPAHILVAEDNPVNRRLIGLQLTRLGHRVDAVTNGREAVEAVRADDSYELVFMDCQMPEMDGLTAARLIRAEAPTDGRRLTLIALTANALDEHRDACLAAGMDAYLAKPLRPRELAEALARWLPADPAHPETT